MENIQGRPEGELFVPKAWALLDLDGVRLRWTNSHLPNANDQAELAQTIATYKKEGLGIAVLTNRPPGQMAPIAYDMGVNYGMWVCESGGSVYDTKNHMAAISPEFVPLIPSIKQLRRELLQNGGVSEFPMSSNEPQFEPGMGFVKTVVVLPSDVDKKNYAEMVIRPVMEQAGLSDTFNIKVGKAIDIDPSSLSKGAGMKLLLSRNGIDPAVTPTLWVADEIRDIDAANVLVTRGGQASAVGNSNPQYADSIRALGGIIAPESTSYHSSLNYILHRFMQGI